MHNKYSFVKYLDSNERLSLNMCNDTQVVLKRQDIYHHHTMKEMDFLSTHRHKNIVNVTEIGDSIVMSHYTHDLSRIEIKCPKQLKYVLWEICCGIKAIHDSGYVHRDIKSHNILCNYKDDVISDIVIADFGTVMLSDRCKRKHIQTLYYAAPETTIDSDDSYDSKVDIWSLACTFYELYSKGYVLFHNDERRDNPLRSIHNPITTEKQLIDYQISRYYMRYINCMKNRELSDLLVHMLEMEPSLRYNIDQIMSHHYFDDVRCATTDMIISRPTIDISHRSLNMRIMSRCKKYISKHLPDDVVFSCFSLIYIIICNDNIENVNIPITAILCIISYFYDIPIEPEEFDRSKDIEKEMVRIFSMLKYSIPLISDNDINIIREIYNKLDSTNE